MATMNIPDSTFKLLEARATALGMTVDAFAVPAVERLVRELQTDTLPTTGMPDDEWKKRFDDLLALARSRDDRYPPGFQADLSRETMYEGCGE